MAKSKLDAILEESLSAHVQKVKQNPLVNSYAYSNCCTPAKTNVTAKCISSEPPISVSHEESKEEHMTCTGSECKFSRRSTKNMEIQ